MYAIQEDTRMINGVKVQTFSRNVRHVNTDLDIEAGTTGVRGYVPREKSSRAFVSLDFSDGDYLVTPVTDEDDEVVGFEIAGCGDGALMGLLDAFSFARDVLRDQFAGEYA